MKVVLTIVLVLLTLVAVFSGVTKVMLMQQEIEFFGRYGFSNAAIIAFGMAQLVGGALLPFKKSRFVGAAVVAITFLASLVMLMMDGNMPVSIVTLVMTLLLGVVMRQRWRETRVDGGVENCSGQ